MNEDHIDIEGLFKDTDREFSRHDLSKVKISHWKKAQKFIPLTLFVLLLTLLSLNIEEYFSHDILIDFYIGFDNYTTELAELIYQMVT